MSKPLISVVVPVYNQEKFVQETIESVLSQQGVEFEVIAINDGSTDRSSGILKQYQDKIIVMEQKNLGVAEARNAGIRRARGDWIAFLDGDDRYLPGHLAQAREFAGQHPEAILFYGDALVIEETGARLGRQKSHPEPSLENLALGNFIVASSVIARKTLFESGEWFRSLHPAEDWDLWLRAAERGTLCHYPWLGVEYRKHFASATQTKLEQAEHCNLVILEDFFRRHPERKNLERRARATVYYESAVRSLRHQALKESRQKIRQSLELDWKRKNSWLVLFLSLLPGAWVRRLIEFTRSVRKWKNR